MLRIIDNKKIDITNDEFKAYNELCKSYDRPNFEGKSLFIDLFETDENGMIIFLKPPGKKYISLEVITFLQNIMVHQHLRKIYDDLDAAVKSIKEENLEMSNEVSKVSKEVIGIRKDIDKLIKNVKKTKGKKSSK